MVSKAAVLTGFDKPLDFQEFEVGELGAGEVLIKLEASGVCGSDVHMWRGKDPRTPLPLILGHEGIGRIAALAGEKTDILGRKLAEGDLVMWERGLMCGKCYYCTIKKQPALCPTRKTYGISISCQDPPHLRGCYSAYLHLYDFSALIKLDGNIDPAVMVPASCSGATAAHTAEQCNINIGDTVVIQGPGPVGLFVLAFAVARGAGAIYVIGTEADKGRLELCKEFGATACLNTGEMDGDARIEFIHEATQGRGADAVIDCTGSPRAMNEGIKLTAPYGVYAMPGIATPVGEVSIPVFEDIARKNVTIQGVWVSDTSHLYQAIRLVETERFPFEKLVTHRFSLDDATKALEVMESKEAIKAVLLPQE
ncbi:zinc-binding dehydrogenase [Candidatus Hydrogenedentota bacterium]